MENAAQYIASKVPPSSIEITLDGLRTLLLDDNNKNSDSAASNNDTLFMKKHNNFIVPFDQVIDSKQKGEKPFLACQYNRVLSLDNNNNNTSSNNNNNTKYRSPWTNNIHDFNSGDDTTSTSASSTATSNTNNTNNTKNEKLLHLERSLNDVWDAYKNLYYGYDSVGSVYLKLPENTASTTSTTTTNTNSIAFHGLFGIRKRSSEYGSWDSANIVTVDEMNDITKECTYKVETYVRVVLTPAMEDGGSNTKTSTDISLTVSKECSTVYKLQPDKIPINVSHIENIGTIIEDNEMELRSIMESVYIPKNYETIIAIQKQPRKSTLPAINPVMNIMMDSGMLKKRLQIQQQQQQNSNNHSNANNDDDGGEGTEVVLSNTISTETIDDSNNTIIKTTTATGGGDGTSMAPKPSFKLPMGVNPLMASAMNSKILKNKKQQE